MIKPQKQILSFLVLGFFYVLFIATTVNHTAEEGTKNEVMKEYDLSVAAGRCAFLQYCQPCHISPEKQSTDNPLSGLFEKLPAPADSFFVKFISDSKTLRESGNSYANAIHQSWKRNYDHKFQYVFTPKEFAGLIAYIKHNTNTQNNKSK